MANTVVILTSGTTWTVPADFATLVSVECLAGAGGGDPGTGTFAGRGGGGSPYAKITSTSTPLTPGVTVINIGIGAGGASGADGTDTWWNASSLANAVTLGSAVACAAQHGGHVGVAGLAANSVGTTKFDGGTGAAGGASANGGGSGGSAGPNGAGGNAVTTTGGTGDGGTVAVGNSGTEFDATHGCGAGQVGTVGVGQNGRNYGGGASGGAFVGSAGGTGAPGLIVIVYTPSSGIALVSRATGMLKARAQVTAATALTGRGSASSSLKDAPTAIGVLTVRARTSAAVRAQSTNNTALTTKATASANSKDPQTLTTALTARSETMLRARVPGGLLLYGRITLKMSENVAPGYLLTGTISFKSFGTADIHMEGKTSSPRVPLLLNSSSQFGASYWKGRNG